jgi:hypothetical protein
MKTSVVVVLICVLIVQVTSAPTSRDKYTWPFASWSIWNLPIGANAAYVPAKLGVAKEQGLAVDPDVILMDPTNPQAPIYYNSGAWTGKSRCTPDSNQVLYTAPMPTNFLVPSDGNNYATAVLLPDNNTFYQTQPLCKCSSSSQWTSYVGFGLNTLDEDGIYGAHGGSGLSAIGGTIRVGEFAPGYVIRHALKVNLDGNLHYYNGTPCYRWPASTCDGYYQSVYGGTIPQLKPGSLLAIPASVNISNMGFKTEAGASLGWTFQNYGGYLVDDTWYWDKFTVETEYSPVGDVRKDFQSIYGYTIDSAGTPFASDVAQIYAALQVVDSWDLSTYLRVKGSNGGEGSGGGAPRQPWAPPLSNVGPTKGPVSAYTIFEDLVTSGWSLSSSGTLSSVTYEKYAGTSSEKLVVTSAWDNYNFVHAGFATSNYTYLHVAILSGQTNSVCFSVQAFHGTWSSSVPQANLQGYGGLPNSYSWSVYNIPLSYLNPSGETIQNILLEDCSGTTGSIFYLDQLQFTTGAYSTTVHATGTSGSITSSGSGTTGGSSTTSTSGSSSTTGGATVYNIFNDAIAPGWGLYSAGLISNYTADKYSGSFSQRLITTGGWQNYDYFHNGFSIAGYQYLHVALKSGQSADVCFEIQAFHGTWTSSVPNVYLTNYGGDPNDSTWKVYNIPLSTLNPSGDTIQHILLTDCSGSGGHTFYMDQLQFLTSGIKI